MACAPFRVKKSVRKEDETTRRFNKKIQNPAEIVMYVCSVLYVLFCMFCSVCSVLYVLFYIFCSVCSVLYILFCIFCSVFSVLYVLFCMFCSIYSVLYILFCVFCSVCSVLYILFCMFCFHRANWHSSATLPEGFPCIFLNCKANARAQLAKKGHGPHSSQLGDKLCAVSSSLILV